MPERTKPGKIHAALLNVMREVPAIAKDQKNTQGFTYRGIDQIYNEVHPLFGKHGVYSTSEVLDSEHRERPIKLKNGKEATAFHTLVTVRYTYWAEDGSSVQTTTMGEGICFGDNKASTIAMAYTDKVAILQLLKIPVVDPDATIDLPEETPDMPKVKPRADRVTPEEVTELCQWWQAVEKAADREPTPDKWTYFLNCTLKKEENWKISDNWTRKYFDKVHAKINAMDEEFKKSVK